MTISECGLHFRWAVLAASFYTILCVDGYAYVFSILRLEIEKEYPHREPWQLSLIGGVVAGMFHLFAPICIAVTERLGPFRVVFVAGTISMLGFVLGWVNIFLNLGYWWDLVFLGIVQGFSSALLYGPAIAVIPNYFPPNQRHLAAGITTAGSGVGAVIFAMDRFSWRGAMMIFAGFSLNVLPCSLIMMETFQTNSRKISDNDKQIAGSNDDGANPTCHIFKKISEDRKHNNPQSQDDLSVINEDEVGNKKPYYVSHDALLLSPSTDDDDAESPTRRHTLSSKWKPFSKAKNLQPSYSRQNSSHIAQSTMWLASLIITDDQKSITFGDILKNYFSTELLCQWSYICLLWANVFSILGYIGPFMLTQAETENPEWSVSEWVRRSLVIQFGFFNAMGRFVTGRLADYGTECPILSSFSLFVIGLSISATACVVFPHLLFLGDTSFVAFMALYSFFIAPLTTCRSLIASDLYGRDHANASFGWILCIQGIAQTLGYALPVWLEQIDRFYAFSFSSVTFLLSIFFVALTFKPFFRASHLRRREKEDELDMKNHK